nr:ATP-binding protein [Planomonospora venezuelensis]
MHGTGDDRGERVTIRMVVHREAGNLVVEVYDGSIFFPVVTAPADTAESGRGLALIQILAANWGYSRTPYGKSVFFELPAWP